MRRAVASFVLTPTYTPEESMARRSHRPSLREGIERILREKLNIPAGDTIEFVTPQFTRTTNDPAPGILAPDAAVFASLETAALPQLREMGLREFGPPGHEDEKPGDPILWLFPAEWYAHIPAGHPIVDISGNREAFEPGVTDNDIRYGCLAYGVLRTP